VELPLATAAGLDDMRLTDRDVLLARSGVIVDAVEERNYSTNLQAPLGGDGGQLLTVYRGWTAVDATVGAVTVRYVNTHLEPPEHAPQVQAAQALELQTALQATDLPIILVGDLNSAADGSSTDTYARFIAAGYRDAWAAAGSGPGETCCHAVDLMNPASTLAKRIDYILFRGGLETSAANLVGDEITDITTAGLWPSDHAGVVATLRVR
jgi:endonuclease/exonuclease/phosphatase family metal-dependent hydrolase